MTDEQWKSASGNTLEIENSGIAISEYTAWATHDRLYRLWVDGHNHGLFWELDMAKEVARRLHDARSRVM